VFVGAVTVTVAVPLALFDDAVIVAVPSPLPVIVAVRPFAVTVATFGSLVVQVTGEESSTRTFAPSFRVTVAFMVPVAFVPPSMSDMELGKTSTRKVACSGFAELEHATTAEHAKTRKGRILVTGDTASQADS
jgi:hypothetical protein